MPGQNLAGGDVEGGKQCGRAVSFVAMTESIQ